MSRAMTHDIRDALIDALRPVCPNPEVAADACLAVVGQWTADEPSIEGGYEVVAALGEKCEAEQEARAILRVGKVGGKFVRNCYLQENGSLWEVVAYLHQRRAPTDNLRPRALGIGLCE